MIEFDTPRHTVGFAQSLKVLRLPKIPRRMSFRARLVRLGVRWFIKHRSGHDMTIEQVRRRAAAAERWVPAPPRSTRTLAIDAGGVRAHRISTPHSDPDRNVLFLHGGGFIIGSSALYRHFTWRLATAARAGVLSIDYRLAPEHPFPAALEDAVAAYRWLLADGADPLRIAVVGDSAGGGLGFALLLRLRDEGVPLPAAAVALSPWTDLAVTGTSLSLNDAADPLINADQVRNFAGYYLAGTDPCQPYVSPLYGRPDGLPPTLIQVGSDEVLLDDAVRMTERMRAGGCRVELEIWPRMPHVWHLFAPIMPEARWAVERAGEFIQQATPPLSSPDRRPQPQRPEESAG